MSHEIPKNEMSRLVTASSPWLISLFEYCFPNSPFEDHAIRNGHYGCEANRMAYEHYVTRIVMTMITIINVSEEHAVQFVVTNSWLRDLIKRHAKMICKLSDRCSSEYKVRMMVDAITMAAVEFDPNDNDDESYEVRTVK